MTGYVAFPFLINCWAVFRAWLIGIAKPSPMEPVCELIIEPKVAIAELTPITAPVASTSGPPLLPGLIAASV